MLVIKPFCAFKTSCIYKPHWNVEQICDALSSISSQSGCAIDQSMLLSNQTVE